MVARFLIVGTLLLRLTNPASAQSPDPTLIAIQALLDSGKVNDAEHELRQFLTAHSNSPDAHYLLAYVLFKQSNPKSSLAEFSEASRYRAPAVLDLEVAGGDYLLLEDYSAADQWFTKAVELAPTEPLARFYLGRAKFNEKHFEEAVRAFNECLRLDPQSSKAADNLGLTYEALGKTGEALTAYRSAVALTTSDPGPYLNLGTLLLENHQAAEALPYLTRALQLVPADARAQRELGKAYAALTGSPSSPDTPLQPARSLLALNRFQDAEQVTRRYLEVHKNSADGHYLLAYILFKEQQAKASLAEYTEAARYRPPAAADLEAVAGDYVLLKDYPDADRWFTKALQLSPDDALGWYYLGRTKYNENRFQEAIEAFQTCLKLDPKNVKAEDNLGLSYEGLNRIEEASTAYRTAIAWQADSPLKDPGPLLDLGSILVESDQAAAGLPYLLQAATISAQDYRVHRQLGKAYARLNQLDQARAELETAVGLAPGNAPIHFMLARVYQRQGLLEKAKAETTRYSKLTAADLSEEK